MTDSTPDEAPSHIVPDLLAPDLRLWFVGTAPSPRSAVEKAYYAHPGNRFWRTLHEVGITPRRFLPTEYAELLALGVGLTDVCKTVFGLDADLPRSARDPQGLWDKAARLRPQGMAFTSKTAAAWALETPLSRINFGQQPMETMPGVALFVLPSPSGLASGSWSLDPWREAADWLAGIGSME